MPKKEKSLARKIGALGGRTGVVSYFKNGFNSSSLAEQGSTPSGSNSRLSTTNSTSTRTSENAMARKRGTTTKATPLVFSDEDDEIPSRHSQSSSQEPAKKKRKQSSLKSGERDRTEEAGVKRIRARKSANKGKEAQEEPEDGLSSSDGNKPDDSTGKITALGFDPAVRQGKTKNTYGRQATKPRPKPRQNKPESITSSPVKHFQPVTTLPFDSRSTSPDTVAPRQRAKSNSKEEPPSPNAERSFIMPTRFLDISSPSSATGGTSRMSLVNTEHEDELFPSSSNVVSSGLVLSDLSDLESMPGDESICPMCHDAVDADLLNDFKFSHPRMTIAQQRKFCDLHTEASARQAWTKGGYPDIDWAKMPTRMAKHYAFLRTVLQGHRSHYTKIFNQKVKTGKDKNRLKSKESLTPGYFGPRGLRVMTETIIDEFTSLLEERALQDTLISARGKVAYVQSVLVPEIAVKLIMEDMYTDEEEARTILTESASLGDVLHEEMEDAVALKADSDDEVGLLALTQ